MAQKWYSQNKEDIEYLLAEFNRVCDSIPKGEFLNYFYANDALIGTTIKGFPYKQFKDEKPFQVESKFSFSEDTEGNVTISEEYEENKGEKDETFEEQMKIAENFVLKARKMGFLQGHMAILDLAHLIRVYENDVEWIWYNCF